MSGKSVPNQLVAMITAIALVLLICRTEAAANEPNSRSVGLVTVSGSVTINNAPAISGQTIFTDSTIVTAADSSMTLNVEGNKRIEVSENSEVKVELSAGALNASLKKGQLICASLSGTALSIQLGQEVSVVSEPAATSEFTITAQEESFDVSVNAGKVEIRDRRKGQEITRVDPGMRYSTSTGLVQNSKPEDGLSEGKRAAIFAIAGGAIALLFIVIVSGADPVDSGFGGCVVVSGRSC